MNEFTKVVSCYLGTPSLVILLMCAVSYIVYPSQIINGGDLIKLLALIIFGIMFIFSLRDDSIGN